MTVTTTNELSVDTSRGDQLQIHVSGFEPTLWVGFALVLLSTDFDVLMI